MRLALIVAAAENEAIGLDGGLPWHLRGDLARFRALTLGHAVIMGSATQRSIQARLGHPLPGRFTVVLTRGPQHHEPDLSTASSPDQARQLAERYSELHHRDTAFVAGGAAVYAQFLDQVDVVHLTRVHAEVAGDTFLPVGWLTGFTCLDREEGQPRAGEPAHTFLTYGRA